MAINITVSAAVREFLEESSAGFREYLENLLETPFDGLGKFIEDGGSDGHDLSNFFDALCGTVQGATAQSVFDEIVAQLREAKKKKADAAKSEREALQKDFDQDEPVVAVCGEEVTQNAS